MRHLSHLFIAVLAAFIIESNDRGAGAVDVDVTDSNSCSLLDESCIAPPAAADLDNNDDNISFNVPPNSSIINYLDPELIGDTELLADITSNLLAGKLVVIHDAFLPEYAEFVYDQLRRNDNVWEHRQYFHPEDSDGAAASDAAYIVLDENDEIAVNNNNEKDASNKDKLLESLRQRMKHVSKRHLSTNSMNDVMSSIRNNITHHNTFNPHHAGHTSRKSELHPAAMSQELQNALSIFNQTSSKQFLSTLSGRNCMSPTLSMTPTQYEFGDYSAPHTDFGGSNSLEFEWTLTKKWQRSYGGSFYWGGMGEVFMPSFNTLILFLPSMISTHYIFPVEKKKKLKGNGKGDGMSVSGGRLSIKGKFHSDVMLGDDFHHNRVSYALDQSEEQAHTRLTCDEAVSIAHDLKPEEYSQDVQKQSSLRELQQSINSTYLYAEYDAKFMVSWEENNSDDGVEREQATINSKDVRISKDSSILDFLNPKLLDDANLLSAIGTNLRKGKMIILRNAFKPEFAEYAWQQMNRSDVEWHGKKATYMNVPLDAKRSTMSPELRSVLRIFRHPKSIKFLERISGRNCAGEGSQPGATWYKPNAYAPPHTDFNKHGSVTLNWDLTKDWSKDWGGSFYWVSSFFV